MAGWWIESRTQHALAPRMVPQNNLTRTPKDSAYWMSRHFWRRG